MPHGDLREDFAGGVIADGEVRARGPVLLAALGVVFDHPSGARSREWEGFREIANHGGMRKTGRGLSCSPVINRVVDLIADKLNAAFGGEGVQVVELRV